MATRTIEATLDTFSVDAGSEITYLGPTAAGNKGDAVRGFRVNPGSTGDIKITLDRTEGVNTMQIFQEDAFATGSAPTGYQKFFDIAKAGKGLQYLFRCRFHTPPTLPFSGFKIVST